MLRNEMYINHKYNYKRKERGSIAHRATTNFETATSPVHMQNETSLTGAKPPRPQSLHALHLSLILLVHS